MVSWRQDVLYHTPRILRRKKGLSTGPRAVMGVRGVRTVLNPERLLTYKIPCLWSLEVRKYLCKRRTSEPDS